MIICELVNMLQQYHPTTEVVATWEGLEENIDVYQAADGRVMIDADNNRYKVDWQKTKCVVCGMPAMGTPFEASKPVCYDHWFIFANKIERIACAWWAE